MPSLRAQWCLPRSSNPPLRNMNKNPADVRLKLQHRISHRVFVIACGCACGFPPKIARRTVPSVGDAPHVKSLVDVSDFFYSFSARGCKTRRRRPRQVVERLTSSENQAWGVIRGGGGWGGGAQGPKGCLRGR